MSDLLEKVVYEPMRKIRHTFRFENESGLNEWWLWGCNLTLTAKKSDTVLGLITWDPIDLLLKEPVSGTNEDMIEFVKSYNESINRDSYVAKHKCNVEIYGYDPTGIVVERYMVYGLTIIEVKVNDLIIDGYDISNLPIENITLTVKFDRAIFEP